MSTYLIVSICIGLLLDFLLGDPRGMPHIVRLVGWLSEVFEKLATRLLGRSVLGGLLLWLLVAAVVVNVYWFVASWLGSWSAWARIAFDGLIVFQCVAYRDLVRHVLAVKDALGRSLEEGRSRVSWIVGRDTDRMQEDDVCRAAVESGAENLSDAVIAPLFWGALLGPLGFLIYRISNTMDAIVGHRTERYEKVGKVSARIDDALNFIPARLCCLAILPFKLIAQAPRLREDANLHPSFNAGWPEAAMAKTLGVVIGGRMYEGGKLVQTKEMNKGARQPNRDDIRRLTEVMGRAYLKVLALAALYWGAMALFSA
ncbi:adenosylcobinamide-phosphate synthase CbiB [Pelagicoccus sp. SDUM812003]|uniref:adenosylcobinamide-phosphate synthase CbiB n=1 Tax=Pelagicoccus sp. SDUM812003 TaxID=3041267 RepID=UPI00280DF05E|nr:adenosylcobinamide-phosphate synthase CbiB [Pelagicoccus sp. SDUM812003]MDQ8203141.1 adenosylcobinamide-phosphate synthase CbiB [Pelagicoccus sp. SDUM812003]